MKPLHKSILVWLTTIMGVLSVLQQQTSAAPAWVAVSIAAALAFGTAVRQWLDVNLLPDDQPVRAMLTSVPLWCGAGSAALTVLQQSGQLPIWAASAVTTVLTVLPIIHRGNLALYADPPPPSKPSVPPGVVGLFVLLFVLPGCGASLWPKACTVGRDGHMHCACHSVNFATRPDGGQARPAGVVTPQCNGRDLPIHVHGRNIVQP